MGYRTIKPHFDQPFSRTMPIPANLVCKCGKLQLTHGTVSARPVHQLFGGFSSRCYAPGPAPDHVTGARCFPFA